jgi:hypothetical protein
VNKSGISSATSTVAAQWLTIFVVAPIKAQVTHRFAVSRRRRRDYFVSAYHLFRKEDLDD